MVEHLLMVQLVIRLIPHGGPNELFLIGMVHIEDISLLIEKSGSSEFPLSLYLSGPLPCVRHHITVNKMC